MQEGSDASSCPGTPSTLSPPESETEDSQQDLGVPLTQTSPVTGTAGNTSDSELPSKICKKVIKLVCGKVLSRDDCVKLLKTKFSVQSKNLVSLTYSQCLQVTSKKLLCNKYVSVPDHVEFSQLKTEDIKVNKKI